MTRNTAPDHLALGMLYSSYVIWMVSFTWSTPYILLSVGAMILNLDSFVFHCFSDQFLCSLAHCIRCTFILFINNRFFRGLYVPNPCVNSLFHTVLPLALTPVYFSQSGFRSVDDAFLSLKHILANNLSSLHCQSNHLMPFVQQLVRRMTISPKKHFTEYRFV